MKDPKGHGSDARGAHSGGVDKIGQPIKLHPKVLDAIRNQPNGFSVTLEGKQPTSGYMVANPGHSEIHNPDDIASERGPGIIQNYVMAHAGALMEPGAHIGGWTDPESKKTYLDVSHNIPGRFSAIQAGIDRNQKAIYDVKRGKDIKTGGTGE